ncbi:MAG: glutamate mutase L [bacterium]|nr:glutamate mutase L [bacterium]
MPKDRKAVLLDFGSTRTKVAVVSLREERILFSGSAASTVKSDARVGLRRCLDMARTVLSAGEFDGALKLASSSAAGGLRIAVIGLSRSLSVTAGRSAAFGAGGRILATIAGKIKAADLKGLAAEKVEIIFFCGGYERGSEEALLHNASVLAASPLQIPVIYAGNSFAAARVRALLAAGGKECFIADNIIPAVGELNTAMAEGIVRDIFLKRIVDMKGLEGVRGMLDGILMPTPAAVLAAGALLSRGCRGEKGIGDLIILDVGGATTDVHSFAKQRPYDGARITGAAEAFAKRTVEGDLGVRESAVLAAEEAGMAKIAARARVSEAFASEAVTRRVVDNAFLPAPGDGGERRVDSALAACCVRAAARRHAGCLERTASAGCKLLQRGKNLSAVKTVIGTGGPLLNDNDPAATLKEALKTPADGDVLLPAAARLYADGRYALYAMGLLAQVEPKAALAIMKKSLEPLA